MPNIKFRVGQVAFSINFYHLHHPNLKLSSWFFFFSFFGVFKAKSWLLLHDIHASFFNLISILDSHILILLKEITALFIWNSNMPTYLKLVLLCTLGCFKKFFTNLQMGVSCHCFNHTKCYEKRLILLHSKLIQTWYACCCFVCTFIIGLDKTW